MDERRIARLLSGITAVRCNEPLNRHCTWHIGGPADWFAEPDSEARIVALRECCLQEKIPLVIIGQGSNLLFDDRGLRGLVMKIGPRFGACRFDGTTVTAEAGVWGPRLVRRTASLGLTGLEHAIGIPGCLGGLIFMNAGSLRRSLGDSILRVRAIGGDGKIVELEKTGCGFAYRSSIFQSGEWIVLGVTLELARGDRRAILAEMGSVLAERKRKFPLEWPSCGSVFSNDSELFDRYGPPGKIIDEAGLKGSRRGAMEVSGEHGNFIINRGGGTCVQVVELMSFLRERVFELTGFWMNSEVRYVTPLGDIFPASRLCNALG